MVGSKTAPFRGSASWSGFFEDCRVTTLLCLVLRGCNCSAKWQLTLSKWFQTNWRTPLNSDRLGAASLIPPSLLFWISLLFSFRDFPCFSGRVTPQNSWKHKPKRTGTARKIARARKQGNPTINSVQTRCIVKGEAQKSPLFWRFSGGFSFSQDRLLSRNSTRKPLNLIKAPIFTNAPCKTACLYNAPSMHTVETKQGKGDRGIAEESQRFWGARNKKSRRFQGPSLRDRNIFGMLYPVNPNLAN